MKTLKDIQVKDRVVLLRVDFNVTVENGEVAEDFRMKVVLPTLFYLKEQGVKKVLLISHFGRPDGKRDERYSLVPVAAHLAKISGEEVGFLAEDFLQEDLAARISHSKQQFFLLENLRFYAGEEANDIEFAKRLASLADIFVQDAFGACHREHASIVGVPKLLPSCAGLLLEKEVSTLSSLVKNPVRPFAVLMGGVKISTKLPAIEKFLRIADNVCLGGALANTALKAKGVAVGKSVVEEEMVERLKNFSLTNPHLHLPLDVKAARDKAIKADEDIVMKAAGSVTDDELILDIGLDTQRLFSKIIHSSKTVLWNGPMGYFENDKFAEGTRSIAGEVAHAGEKAFTVVGGGDTYPILQELGVFDKIGFISTGGGAMLEFLANETLVGIEILEV